MLVVDRTAIDQKYSVLPFVPQYEAVERLVWPTRIFIASDLSETRESLSPYPAIYISYNIELQLDNRDFLFQILSDEEIKNTWVLPYFPHSTPALIVADAQGDQVVYYSTVDSANYPFDEHYMVYTRDAMVYKPLTDMACELPLRSQIWFTPCYYAYIFPELTTSDMGKCRYGHEVTLTFRMAARTEKVMTYHSDSFDFYGALTVPIQTNFKRYNNLFMEKPAPAYTYTASSRLESETAVVQASYFLKYDAYHREDFPFRGVFMKGLGISADEYVYPGRKHRLADSSVSITYSQGHATADTTMREVSA